MGPCTIKEVLVATAVWIYLQNHHVGDPATRIIGRV